MSKEFNFTGENTKDWLLPFLKAFKKQTAITDSEEFAIKNVEKIFKKNMVDSVFSVFSNSTNEEPWKECAKSYTLKEITNDCRKSIGFNEQFVPKTFKYNTSYAKESDDYKHAENSYNYLKYSDDIQSVIGTPSSDYTRRDDVLHKYRLMDYLKTKKVEPYTDYNDWIAILIAAYENTDIIVIVNDFSKIKYTTDKYRDFEFLKSHTPAEIVYHTKLNLDISTGLTLSKGGKRTKKRKSKRSKKSKRKTRSKRQRGGTKINDIIHASKNGDTEQVESLLENEADGQTALIWASRYGRTETVEMLLKKGVDVNAKDRKGRTPLMLASESGHTLVVEKLLENGADVNAKDDSGYTPLMLASEIGHALVVEKLLENGADVNAPNDRGYTPLMLACECDIDDIDLPYYQVIYEMNNKHKIVKMLLNHPNIEVNAKTDNDDTALDIANKTECSPEIIKLLKQHIVAQPIPKHLKTQRERKKDRQNLHVLMTKKGVHPDLDRFAGYYLGGKIKTRRKRKRR